MQGGSPPLQRHSSERAQLFDRALALPLDSRRDLATSLLWSLPREEISKLNERLNVMLQKDIIGLLPPELTFLILGKLDLEDLLRCSLVCRKWAKLLDEQGLWALICASHRPPIKPANTTWADITRHRQLSLQPHPRTPTQADEFAIDESPYELDDRIAYVDVIGSQGGMGGGGGLDPLGMAGGLRRTVWERGGPNGTSGGGLPTHLQHPTSIEYTSTTSFNENPISSHVAVPSAKPQAKFKHLYIIHHILSKRMCTPRPIGPAGATAAYHLNRSPAEFANMTGIRPLPGPITINTISSVKAGGLAGHSEAIYSLSLINHPMRINMLQSCPDCHVQFPTVSQNEPTPTPTSVNDEFVALQTNSPSSRRLSTSRREKGATVTTISGRDWLLSGSRDRTLRLWQLSHEPRVVKVFHGGHSGSVLSHSVVKVSVHRRRSSSSLSSDSPAKGRLDQSGSKERVMAVSGGSDGKICLWDVEGGNGEPEKVIDAHEDSVLCVRADDEKVVSCSKDKTIRVFDVNTLRELLTIGGNREDLHRGAVNAVNLSKEYIISASGDKTIRVWSIHTGELLSVLEAHNKGIASIDFSPRTSFVPQSNGVSKGSIVSGCSDASIKSFDLFERSQRDMLNFPGKNDQNMTSTTLSEAEADDDFETEPDPSLSNLNLLERTSNYTLRIRENYRNWSPCICPPGLARVNENGGCGRCGNHGHTGLVRTVFLGDEVVVSGSYDATVKVWNRQTGKLISDLSGAHVGRVFSVVSDRMRIISSGLDCRINIWDFSEGLDTSFVEP
ncbi:hypothetical protein IAR55_006542 [Kwoniella newhampshirensis]|uniref:F-box domain-containing protein n=1 Tax=Kwoniella newhampshirensis TaxID=1651941 RepID=A0AAW0YIX4_9TREE